MKRNQTKLKWKEMNFKQRVFFVLDWIMRIVLIVTVFLFVIAIVMNLSSSNNDTSAASCVFADEDPNYWEEYDRLVYPDPCIYYLNDDFYYSSRWDTSFSLTSWVICDFPFVWNGYNCRYIAFLINDTEYKVSVSAWFDGEWNEVDLYDLDDGFFDDTDSGRTIVIGSSIIESVEYWLSQNSTDVIESEVDSAYNDGYLAGESSVDYLFTGVFYGSTLSADVTYFDNVSESTYVKSFSDLPVNLGYNTFLFDAAYNYIDAQRVDVENDNVQSVSVVISLKFPFSYVSERAFYISGSSRSDIFDITLVDTNGKRYSGSFDPEHGYFAYFPDTLNSAAAIVSIEMYFGRAQDTMPDASLTQDSGNDFQGYNEGLSDGISEGYYDGIDVGYSEGYSVGFQEGFDSQGSGSFGWLVSSVQNFLNTPFFGTFSIGTLLYVALGVTFVMLFLKFFAGG